jgi:flagellar motor switch/type III secretory pathway protein FliN
MATQSPPQSVISSASAAASHTAAPMRSPAGPGGAGEGGSVHASHADAARITSGSPAVEQANGTTNLIPSGSQHANAVTAGSETTAVTELEALRLSPPLERLPVGLVVSVPVREFRIRNLLAMAPGELIETQWGHGEDLPLSSGDVQLAWSEFEVVDTRLAVRVTRLA